LKGFPKFFLASELRLLPCCPCLPNFDDLATRFLRNSCRCIAAGRRDKQLFRQSAVFHVFCLKKLCRFLLSGNGFLLLVDGLLQLVFQFPQSRSFTTPSRD